MGIVSYTAEMPDIFHTTKINLNITLRSITSGIPLRAIDILGCGGFLLSNYQPELCEYFTPDVDFVYFEDPDDLAEKSHLLSLARKRTGRYRIPWLPDGHAEFFLSRSGIPHV